MNQKCSPEMRERVLWMLDQVRASGEHPNLMTAVRRVAGLLGVSPETLRVWHRRREVDTGQRPGVPTEMIRFLDEHREWFGVEFLCRVLKDVVPVESFAAEDVGEYAGRVYDYHLEHPELERLLRWEGLAFDAGNPDDERRLGLYRDKTAAVEAGQRAGGVTEEIDADHMIFLILSLAGWWPSVPQVARMLTGPDTEAERARRRESVVRAARRIARPD